MYNFFDPTRVLFGAGQLGHLHEQTMPGKKAMVVISNGKSTRENGALDRTMNELHQAGVETVLFDKVGANPLKSVVEEGGRFARDNGCDFVVALGGGSVMDAAKIMAMYALQPGDLWDYVAGATGKMKPLVNPTLPIIAITTTAGTGSEVDQWGVVTNPETNEKIGCGGMDSLFPVIAVVDPELMATVPPKFTAYQGFDALFHSTEGYMSGVTSLMGDMVQLAAIENIGKYLPHGAGLIMISKEYYTHFINKHCCDERFIRMAQALGKTDAKDPMDFVTALVELQEACGVADLKMSDYGIQKEECMTLAKNARATMGGLFMADPVQMTDEECAAIYEKSYR